MSAVRFDQLIEMQLSAMASRQWHQFNKYLGSQQWRI